jgi:hypothetical protein
MSFSTTFSALCIKFNASTWLIVYIYFITYVQKCRNAVKIWRSIKSSGVPIIGNIDVIIRSDDRFLNLVVDSDSIVSKIYMLNFVLWLFFFSVSILTKILQFYPSWFLFALILTNIWQFCPSVLLTLSQYTYLD